MSEEDALRDRIVSLTTEISNLKATNARLTHLAKQAVQTLSEVLDIVATIRKREQQIVKLKKEQQIALTDSRLETTISQALALQKRFLI